MLTTDKRSRRFLALTTTLAGLALGLSACVFIPSDPGFPEEPKPTPTPSDTLVTAPAEVFYAELAETFPIALTNEDTKLSAKRLGLAACDALDEGVPWDDLYEQAFADSQAYGSLEIAIAGVHAYCPEHNDAITITEYK